MKNRPEIKICGITREEEAIWLNEADVDYAGFVLYEKSRRYISILEAKRIFKKLNKSIKKIAVLVSPDYGQIGRIEHAGFDAVQIHGTFEESVINRLQIPAWIAANYTGKESLEHFRWCLRDSNPKIQAFLMDAKDYGSGRTFGWERFPDGGRDAETEKESLTSFRNSLREQKIHFVLAGGLHPGNVSAGIRLFEPDIVDVSTGVETAGTKDRAKIMEFAGAVKREKCNGKEINL